MIYAVVYEKGHAGFAARTAGLPGNAASAWGLESLEFHGN